MEVDNNSTTAAEQSPNVEKKKSRRGFKSRQKAAEKFRTHKNETKGAEFIKNRINSMRSAMGFIPDELFGPMVTSLQVIKPVQEVEISTHKLPEVAAKTVETLVNACKVPTTNINRDIETVQLAASLQLEAKLCSAQRNTPFATSDSALDIRVERTCNNLQQSILPVAAYLDQIGRVEVDGQTFVPREGKSENGELLSFSFKNLVDPSLYNKDQYGFIQGVLVTADGNPFQSAGQLYPMNKVGMHGGNVHLEVFNQTLAVQNHLLTLGPNGEVILNPDLGVRVFPPPDIGRFIELGPRSDLPTFDQVVERYHEFMSRVQKKVTSDKLPMMALDKGAGSEAQLCIVGPFDGNRYRDVWCARNVNGHSMFISAMFELNTLEDQACGHQDVCFVRTTVDSGNGVANLVRSLTMRVNST